MVREYEKAGVERLHGAGLRLFTKSELEEIHYATLDTLWETGVLIEDESARKLLEESGCVVDHKKKIVKIPEYIVKEALQKAPSRFRLVGRTKEKDVVMEAGKKVHWTNFGTAVHTLKYENGKPQWTQSTEEDLAKIALLIDYCENIDFYTHAAIAGDYVEMAEDVHELFTPLVHTSKPVTSMDALSASFDFYREIAKAYYGGDEELARKRPPFSTCVCPVSPLQYDANGAQVIMKSAKYNIPVNIITMAMAGATAPIHLAGTVVIQNAELLGGFVLSQMCNPGAPVWYGCSTTLFDLKRGTAPVGAPELGLISAAAAELAQYYGLPSFVAGI